MPFGYPANYFPAESPSFFEFDVVDAFQGNLRNRGHSHVVTFRAANIRDATECQRHWNADNSETHGHKHIGTTALYCDVSEETLRNAVEVV
jgi:hypothetical protein